jgi:O-antigen/teichoic acid export membrane protein
VVPLGVGVILLGPWLLQIFGPHFASGYPTLVILTISITSAALGGHAGFVLTMTGNERFAARIIIASAVTNLALSILLTRHYGMIGTALATCICTIFRNVLMVWQAQRKVGVSLMPW